MTELESSTDEEYAYVMSHNSNRSSIPRITVSINEISVHMIVGTGASIDILDEDTYNRINYKSTFML